MNKNMTLLLKIKKGSSLIFTNVYQHILEWKSDDYKQSAKNLKTSM